MNENKNCSNKINITFLNVCGLKSKLLCPDFVKLIDNNDISIFVESKLDQFDFLELPSNYSYISKVRKKCKKSSGGIVIMYKKSLETFLEFPNTECEYVQWLKIKKGLLFEDKDVLLGCVYLPPENTKHTSPEAFEAIDDEFNKLATASTYGAFLGDFNSKIGKLQDYTVPDELLLDVLDLDSDVELLNFLYDYENLQRQGIPLNRVSQDNNRPNSYGYKLIEFCNRLNLYIGNSRLPGNDKNIGIKTCFDSSLIDYFILSSPLFKIVKDFTVMDFDPMLSDKHSRLVVTLEVLLQNVNIPVEQTPEKLIKWNEEKKGEFISAFQADSDHIQILIEELNFLGNRDDITKNDVDSIVDYLILLFKNAAAKSFGFTKLRGTGNIHSRSSTVDSKPWFNADCKAKRKKFHESRHKYNLIKNSENKKLMNDHSKEYKNILNKSFKNYQNEMEHEMRKMSQNDSKSFWKILSKMSGEGINSKSSDNIDVEKFFSIFQRTEFQ